MYEVKIVKDSIGPSKQRLTTWLLTYPRFIHSELLTHRVTSKNSASSRAIPTATLIQRLQEDPVFPKFWGKNQAGMQSKVELSEEELPRVKASWLSARNDAITSAKYMQACGLHKQIANRILEPWMFITVILTCTAPGLNNLFRLRYHPDAQPEFQWLAKEMCHAYAKNQPEQLQEGQWHLPFFDMTEDDPQALFAQAKAAGLFVTDAQDVMRRVASGRIARVSYLTHDGVRDPMEDIKLSLRLSGNTPPHISPHEHIAQAMSVESWNDWAQQLLRSAKDNGECFNPHYLGNLIGWFQYRKMFEGESGFDFDWQTLLTQEH